MRKFTVILSMVFGLAASGAALAGGGGGCAYGHGGQKSAAAQTPAPSVPSVIKKVAPAT